MKNIIISILALFFSYLSLNAQSTTPSSQSLSIQIGNSVNPVYDTQGNMIIGFAVVSFSISDSSTVRVNSINAESEVLKNKLKRQMDGMKLNATESEKNKNMHIRINFVKI
jgi:hypothetical protein